MDDQTPTPRDEPKPLGWREELELIFAIDGDNPNDIRRRLLATLDASRRQIHELEREVLSIANSPDRLIELLEKLPEDQFAAIHRDRLKHLAFPRATYSGDAAPPRAYVRVAIPADQVSVAEPGYELTGVKWGDEPPKVVAEEKEQMRQLAIERQQAYAASQSPIATSSWWCCPCGDSHPRSESKCQKCGQARPHELEHLMRLEGQDGIRDVRFEAVLTSGFSPPSRKP
jgi:hypothetical protein